MLPIDHHLGAVRAALAEHPCAALIAPPGAGKTTRVPLALLEEPWAQGRKILLLSPRRLAARAAAARMAASLGEPVGRTIGYRVRLDAKVSAATRIEVVTEGVFTRRILADPELADAACVIFDEFHERSLEGDLGLALARDAQLGLREDLRLLVMSATLDGARVAALLGACPVIESAGRAFPVAIRHLGRDPRARLEEAVALACRRALAAESGSILAFLPGAGEIERTAERLRDEIADPAVDIHTLYGALDPADQDAALAPPAPGRRKIVLATSIAETSLTIEGVRVVIDGGMTRKPRYEPGVGLTRLETVRVSQAAAAQRAGRAGRTEPGACWRLWDEGETRALPPFDKPEILEADLAGLALDLAAWGVADPAGLALLDPPPQAAWADARSTLSALGAIDADGRISPHGRALAAFGLPPRLAHMVIRGAESGAAALAGKLAVLLTEQGLGGREFDLVARLDGFERDRSPRAAQARRLALGLAERAQRLALPAEPGFARPPLGAAALVALAFPERVAKARAGKPGEFVMVNGRAALVNPAEPLARAPFLAVAEASGGASGARALLAAALTEAEVLALFGAGVAETIETTIEGGAVRARRMLRLGGVVLSEAPIARPPAAEAAAALLSHVRAKGLGALPWSEAAVQTRARIAFLRKLEGDPWPEVSEAALLESLADWLAPALAGVDRLDQLDAGEALLALLPWDLRRRLNEEAPTRFETPAGGAPTIDYAAESGPVLAARLQEFFGLDRHPAIASGRAPLVLSLLSPAGRPVQTTRDLPGFWRGSYAAVRADLRGRYPKHPWPENPLTAEPTRRAKPRGS